MPHRKEPTTGTLINHHGPLRASRVPPRLPSRSLPVYYIRNDLYLCTYWQLYHKLTSSCSTTTGCMCSAVNPEVDYITITIKLHIQPLLSLCNRGFRNSKCHCSGLQHRPCVSPPVSAYDPPLLKGHLRLGCHGKSSKVSRTPKLNETDWLSPGSRFVRGCLWGSWSYN